MEGDKMKKITKTTMYIDAEERKKMVLYFASIDIYTYNQLSSELGITPQYMSLIMKGKRPITENIMKQLKRLGYEM